MKKIFIAITALYLSVAALAQSIDRSKQPQPGPAPVIKIADPAKFVLPNGMTVLVVENHKLPKVSASLISHRGPILEGEKVGALSLMGQMLNEGTRSLSKEQFDEKVDMMGASVSLSSGGGGVSALTRYFEPSLMLLADALRNPAFGQESFDKLKSQTITGLKSAEKSAKAISSRVVNAIAYGKNSANGEFETVQTTEALTLHDIKTAYQKYLSPANAILTFVGDITPAQAKALATKAFGTWKGKKMELAKDKPVPNPPTTEINIVDVPSAVQSEITVSNLISNPYNNPDYHALTLANYILGGGSESKLFQNLREKHAFTYGCYSDVGSGLYQTMFSAETSVRNEKVDSAVVQIINEIENMRQGKITTEELTSAKAVYNGSFALRMENPANAASYATTILTNNLPKNYYRTFLQKINAVTIADIKRVSQKYFTPGNSRIFVVGKATSVTPSLDKLGHLVKTYDNYANPLTATVPIAVDKSITAQSIIDKYITAIGGNEALINVQSLSADIEMTISGQPLNGIMKKMVPNKFLMHLSMQNMTVMKMLFNGKTGYQQQMGNKEEMDADELSRFSDMKGIFDQLYYHTEGYKLSAPTAEKVNGQDAYKIIVTKPSGKTTTEYYAVSTGLLIREENMIKLGEQEAEQSMDFIKYTPVGSVKVPEVMVQSVMGKSFQLTMSNYKINQGVTDKDFE